MSQTVVALGEGRPRFPVAAGSYRSSPNTEASMAESPSQAPLVLVASGGEWVGDRSRTCSSRTDTPLSASNRVAARWNWPVGRIRTRCCLTIRCPTSARWTFVARCATTRSSIERRPSSSPRPRSRRAECAAAAYAAGAWDYSTLPVDVETLLGEAWHIRASSPRDRHGSVQGTV